MQAWAGLAGPGSIAPGSLVTAGFDGARRKDSTAIVITELATGTQEVWALWERDVEDPDWEIDEAEVNAAVDDLFRVMDVYVMFCTRLTGSTWSASGPSSPGQGRGVVDGASAADGAEDPRLPRGDLVWRGRLV